MSFVNAAPEFVSAAASDFASIGSTLDAAHAAAVAPTTGVLAAGGDEVSEVIATLFAGHARAYQALSAQAASFHQEFVQLMNAGAGSYASTEAANVSPLQNFEAAISRNAGALRNRFDEAVAKLETAPGAVTALTVAELVAIQKQAQQWAAVISLRSSVIKVDVPPVIGRL
jgi:PE family